MQWSQHKSPNTQKRIPERIPFKRASNRGLIKQGGIKQNGCWGVIEAKDN